MEEVFTIDGLAGERTLEGEIPVRGAKNAALKALMASVLFKDTVRFKNVPQIEDIARTTELLEDIGAEVNQESRDELSVTVPKDIDTVLPEAISKRFRASVVLTGPILSRFGKVTLPYPGGCVIGKRPVDIFLDGFEKMGATVKENDGCFEILAKHGLRGADIFLRVPSVTVTETFMMAGVLAEGVTRIRNVALEPEIQSLAEFLVACGAKIRGIGTTTLEIEGGDLLLRGENVYETPPDRIEAGSFVILAALAGKDVLVSGCNPEHFEGLLDTLLNAGVNFTQEDDAVRVYGNEKRVFESVGIKTHEYPGFPTDLQAPMAVFLTQAKGEALVHETIFEGRLHYTEELTWMGADIMMLDPHRMLVKGPTPLKRCELKSPDLRAGMAYVIAGIIAEGTSTIHNVYNIDRGYEKLQGRLSDIGVNIKREKKG